MCSRRPHRFGLRDNSPKHDLPTILRHNDNGTDHTVSQDDAESYTAVKVYWRLARTAFCDNITN